jgi:hypothetical protein
VVNPDAKPAEPVLRIDAGADFADLVEVKDHDLGSVWFETHAA